MEAQLEVYWECVIGWVLLVNFFSNFSSFLPPSLPFLASLRHHLISLMSRADNNRGGGRGVNKDRLVARERERERGAHYFSFFFLSLSPSLRNVRFFSRKRKKVLPSSSTHTKKKNCSSLFCSTQQQKRWGGGENSAPIWLADFFFWPVKRKQK